MKAEARSIGQIARQALQRADKATVIASFDRSFYMDVDHQIICVVDERLYDGPLNLLLRTEERSPGFFDRPITAGEPWTVRSDALWTVDEPAIRIDFGASAGWRPKPRSALVPDCRKVEGSLNELKKLAGAYPRPDGLLDLILGPDIEPESAVARAAWAPIRGVQKATVRWLDDGSSDMMVSLGDLLGLGPGLTPSGDDVIAGLLIAAHYLGKGRAASALWRRLESVAGVRTHQISLAHLSAAGQGMGAAPLHDLLDALIENRTEAIAKALDAVAKIGHCSGWDAVGGLLLLFNAWIEVGKGQSIAA